MADNFVVISGCSGGGKSTTLEALKKRGHYVIEEPGRRIVASELASGGSALPWRDPIAFARRAIRLSLADRQSAEQRCGLVFFDRGLIDATSALQELTGKPYLDRLAKRHPYCKTVFLTPPWPQIYVTDNERRHSIAEARQEYDRLCRVYPALGYDVNILPRVDVAERVDRILAACS